MAEIAANVESPADPGRLAPLSRFRCQGCGYGASSRIAPERCPMCGGCTWSYERASPFSTAPDTRPRPEPSY